MTSAESTACGVAVLVEVLEQLLARQVLAAPDDAGEAAVVQRRSCARRRSCRGSRSVSVDRRRRRRGGRAAWSGRSELVLAGVLLVADADQRRLEQADDRREHLLARQAAAGARSASTRCADRRAAPRRRPSCARTWSRRGPRASAGGSGTACGRGRRGRSPGCGRSASRADPDVGPGRRDGERLDAGEGFLVAHGGAVRGDVAEVLA